MADDNPDRGWLTDEDGADYHQKNARRAHYGPTSWSSGMYATASKSCASDGCVAITVISLRVATFVFSLVAIAFMAWGSWYLPGYSMGDYYVPRKQIDPFQYSGLRLVPYREYGPQSKVRYYLHHFKQSNQYKVGYLLRHFKHCNQNV